MGINGSSRLYIEPVRYSIYDDSVDSACEIEDNLNKLRRLRLLALVSGMLATVFTLLALVTPCWIINVKGSATWGIFHMCLRSSCAVVRGNGFLQGVAAMLAVMTTVAAVFCLFLHNRTLTEKAILCWNLSSCLLLVKGVVFLLLTIHLSIFLTPGLEVGGFYGFSYFCAWIGVAMSLLCGAVRFYLSHKFVWVIHSGPSVIRDFSMETSKD